MSRPSADDLELLFWEHPRRGWQVTRFQLGDEWGSYGRGFVTQGEAFARAWRVRCEDHPGCRISINKNGLFQ